MLWQNDNAIIIGKHQNTVEEINQEFVDAHHIHVLRRLTGGGAVYHDMENLNFSFIVRQNTENSYNFRFFVFSSGKWNGISANTERILLAAV